MKGGITSGVVYPNAIELLSHHYRFKNIGGTSAGAIAAAVTAAAEFNRRKNGSRAGFDLLAQLPTELKAEVTPGRRKLLSLFQPQPGCRRLFAVLVNALNSQGTGHRILSIVAGALRAYWFATLASVVVALLARLAGGDVLAVALTLLVALLVSVAAAVYRDVTRNVVANGFGLCKGCTEDPKHEALTPWLHDLIQRAAGRTTADDPLTFGDLWDAPGFPVGMLTVPPGRTNKSINLEIFSSNLGHGRPYIFPLAEDKDKSAPTRFRDRDRLYFNGDELKDYLPDDVHQWLCNKGRDYQCEPGREGRDPSEADALRLGLKEIPEPRDFPIVLAARMSLSFPFLFAAVPLWAIDHDQAGQATFRRCWFSDGGISSNFPMHLFDGLVPLWPTFGINLEPEIAGRGDVYLPTDYSSGYGERWDNFDDASPNGASRFGGFLSAIVGTMQNWNDNALSRMPGVRDRIARVRLSAKEGGLNLNMEAAVIEAVARRGGKAAGQIVGRFAPAGPNGANGPGWDEQRWVRLGVLLKLVEERAPGVLTALKSAGVLAGKLLRIDREGRPAAGNAAPANVDPRVFASGLREPIAVAFHPNTEAALVGQRRGEQPDDIAVVRPAANGAWDPRCAPPKSGYCDVVAEQGRGVSVSGLASAWRGGMVGDGITAIERLRDPVWGAWRNAFVVAFDNGQRLDLVKLSADGSTQMAAPVLEKLGVGFKALAEGPDGLYVITRGKPGGEEIWRLTPQ